MRLTYFHPNSLEASSIDKAIQLAIQSLNDYFEDLELDIRCSTYDELRRLSKSNYDEVTKMFREQNIPFGWQKGYKKNKK